MFKILDGREYFYQWDLNQKLIVEDDSINEVHFSNRTDGSSLVVEVDELRQASVPNILLQDYWDIRVYAYCYSGESKYTKVEEKFEVKKRSKPSDYVYTETEIKRYDDLEKRIDNITYVDYSKAQELTDEQKSQARTNIGVEIPDVSGKMDKNNPTGTGSFSLNRKAGSTVGNYSHAEGYNTTASGNSGSHAEGNNTTASGPSSHAEGWTTTASGSESHAEGSHTTASGADSHAEGNSTTASGFFSHAEGSGTTASGHFSHAEGSDTTASSSNQHVQGRNNIEDSSNIYADIIGNGTSTTKRSNAATIDWHGNAWYAGDVYVGSTSGTNKDEGSKKLATEEYVDNSVIVPAPSSADEGKILRVMDGKATWGSLPSASGVSF